MKKNRKGFTLLEMIIYVVLLMLGTAVILYLITAGLRSNDMTSMYFQRARNADNTERYLSKATENIQDYLIVSNLQTNAAYNGFNFSVSHIVEQCDFIVNDKYDLIAFTASDSLDPTIIGVIEKEKNGRTYRQLAIYKYYSTYSELEKIKKDYTEGRITNYIGENGTFKTQWLTPYKCNPENGFLIPVSSKFYIDRYNDSRYEVNLDAFKVLAYNFNDRNTTDARLVEMRISWETLAWERSNVIHQYFSKNFTK